MQATGHGLGRVLPSREAFDSAWDSALAPLELQERCEGNTVAQLWPLESWWAYVMGQPPIVRALSRVPLPIFFLIMALS